MSLHDTSSDSQCAPKCPSLTPTKPSSSLLANSNDKEDLSSSYLLSANSPIVTEDLLINEKLEFSVSESEPSSEPVSLTYTKSIGSRFSSIFPSFEASNFCLNSVPLSNEESFTAGKRFELSAPQMICSEFRTDYLKIPNLTVRALNRLKGWSEENSSKPETQPKEAEPVSISGLFIETQGLEDLKTTGKGLELGDDTYSKKCNCDWCTIS